MELEEAIQVLKDLQKCDLTSKLVITKAVELVLKTLEKSIPKKKIEDVIKTFDEENEVVTQEEYYARSYIRKFLQELLEE